MKEMVVILSNKSDEKNDFMVLDKMFHFITSIRIIWKMEDRTNKERLDIRDICIDRILRVLVEDIIAVI